MIPPDINPFGLIVLCVIVVVTALGFWPRSDRHTESGVPESFWDEIRRRR